MVQSPRRAWIDKKGGNEMVRPVSQNMAAFMAVLAAALTGMPQLRADGGAAGLHGSRYRVRPTVPRRTTHFAANGAREMERRQRQIARGQLKKANGLVSDV